MERFVLSLPLIAEKEITGMTRNNNNHMRAWRGSPTKLRVDKARYSVHGLVTKLHRNVPMNTEMSIFID